MTITDAELLDLEHRVDDALRRGDPSVLPLLGEGEISLVLRAGADPGWACKRLPPFADEVAADRYAGTIERYVHELEDRGVDVLDTTVRRLTGPAGATLLYCVQPIVRGDRLAVALATADPAAGRPLVERIVEVVLSVVDDRLGLDAQLSNWAVDGDRLIHLDITTPLMCGPDGRPELDTEVFVASLPWVLRGAVRRWVVPGILGRYHDPRTVAIDLASNLIKEGLDELVPTVVDATAGRVEPAITVDEIRRDRRGDAATWTALQTVRRLDRAWQRHVRRRPYPFLLPAHTRS